MDIIEQLLLLSFLFAAGSGVLVAQVIALNRVFRKASGFYSPAWALFGVAFASTGLLRVWSMIRLPIAILRAKTQGVLPEQLNKEQWITIGVSLLAMALFIIALDRHRRDLRKLGV